MLSLMTADGLRFGVVLRGEGAAAKERDAQGLEEAVADSGVSHDRVDLAGRERLSLDAGRCRRRPVDWAEERR